ncbi:hypothetical protein VTJ83DRAFT_1968 [Remersonia thermophila]|uniref:L-lysine 2,3-aminomutase n=1 Tax=Remersonia thermophila TaxID=72144 RepID=A0ABR4DHK9_9PEZI
MRQAMLSMAARRVGFGRGLVPLAAALRTAVTARAASSDARLQALVVDIRRPMANNDRDMPPIFALESTPTPSAAPQTIIHPVSTALPQDYDEFWRKVPLWRDVSVRDFLSYRWSTKNMVDNKPQLLSFLRATVPDEVPLEKDGSRTQTRDEYIEDVFAGITAATMSVRMTRIDWSDPRNDPIARQFLPLKSMMLPDHPKLTLDSLGEEADSPVKGLVHRYPDKVLFLATSVCPTYCTFCTRSYAVGADTATVTKRSLRPGRQRWDAAIGYIAGTPQVQDVVVSGGDSYYLTPDQLRTIADRILTEAPHVKRIRFASKGLAVAPLRLLGPKHWGGAEGEGEGAGDGWAEALIDVSNRARREGKQIAWHTHFNHPNEISWITRLASQRLYEEGVVVRNQTVLLRGVNDDVETMGALIRGLADIQIAPYYVYQCDMVKSVEHLRTPLRTILDLESRLRGSIAGFAMPSFVVDLPGGGGKRLACSFESYDRTTGVSHFRAPAVKGHGGKREGKMYEYYDPVDTLPAPERLGGS